jgi:hypothetical protein
MSLSRLACLATVATLAAPISAAAATISVPAGGNLQTAIDSARAGDTILLQPGATYAGNFRLPVHGGATFVTIRSSASDTLLPAAGVRMTPAYRAYLPKIISTNNLPAIRTAPSAMYWRLMFLEIGPSANPTGTIVDLGDGSSAQNTLSLVPRQLIVDRVYIHGDATNGQRRGIGLNSGDTTIVNSHISDIKSVGQDSQAIGGWNGPGPFQIENNYLEGAGEVVMFGGDDARIPNLTPSDIVFRYNTVSRPLAWRDPILGTPQNVRATLAGSGSLAAGTYAYRVVARRTIAGTIVRSLTAPQISVSTAAGGAVQITWDAVADATEYLVYGRTPGAQDRYWRTVSTGFVDDGTNAGTAGTPPSTASVWQVKNLFELKNARRAQIDHNLIENNWAQAQTGAAILFTPRNQYGGCTWCIVEDVVFEYNLVRRMGGGMQLLGWDDERPSQQMNNIVIRHNEFSDLNKSWGGSAYFLYVIDAPRNVTVDHNTVISPVGSGAITADKRPAEAFVFTNNVMRHNTYGIIGTNTAPGMGAINLYFPGSVITRNVLAGGSASQYPAGNLFPTIADFEAHFVNYLAADYALAPATNWANAGTDGKDLGADMAQVRAPRDGGETAPLSIVTASLPATTAGEPYSVTLAADGGVPPYAWSVTAGSLPAGIGLDPVTGEIGGTATTAGDYSLTVRVTDASGSAASTPLTMRVQAAVIPLDIVTTSFSVGVVGVPYAAGLEASGGSGSYRWTVTGGALPSGLSLASNGVVGGTPAQQGTSSFTVTLTDAAGLATPVSSGFAIVIAPAQNQPPTVALSAPAANAVVPVGATITLAAIASDPDGVVSRVDFYVNDQLVGNSSGPGFTVPWLVPASGTYRTYAIATDDRGVTAASGTISIGTKSEVVLYASEVVTMAGNYKLLADSTAAGGYALWNQNRAPKKVTPKVFAVSAAPSSYAEFTFFAEAGRPYQLWLRGRAESNDPTNDSVYVQFDGMAAARIGTTAALTVNLEDAASAGVSGWGWQDNGYGVGVLGAPVTFERTGLQKVRFQPREDGLMIDQIVVSPEQFRTTAPGALKDDTTIMSR